MAGKKLVMERGEGRRVEQVLSYVVVLIGSA
jgi:hypothetical protein